MDEKTLERHYAHVYEQSGKLFASECALIERAISFSFAVYFHLVKAARASKLNEKSEYLAILFYRNCVYLSASYQLIRSGMLDPAGNNLRTVFETILWQYAYLCDDELYANFLEVTKLEDLKFKLIKTGKWSNTKERTLENLRRKYNVQKMMKRLYSTEVFEKFFFNPYWVMSQKAHSSIFGVNYNTPNLDGSTTIERRPEELKDNLKTTLYLCAENLICFLNCFSDYLPQIDMDQILKFTNLLNANLPPTLPLVPNKKEMKFTLRFKEV